MLRVTSSVTLALAGVFSSARVVVSVTDCVVSFSGASSVAEAVLPQAVSDIDMAVAQTKDMAFFSNPFLFILFFPPFFF
jgi:hypothetical protein